jgi:hypothetical protein
MLGRRKADMILVIFVCFQSIREYGVEEESFASAGTYGIISSQFHPLPSLVLSI